MIVAILQARMSSARLPGKVLAPLEGVPMIGRQLERIARARRVTRMIVATSSEPDDDPIASVASDFGAACYRGSLDDVLDRFRGAARSVDTEHVVRLTADCPLTDPRVLDRVVAAHLESGCDYTANVIEPRYPDGLDVEVVTSSALERLWKSATQQDEREHVTLRVHRHPNEFSRHSVRCDRDLSSQRWTVDFEQDLEFVRRVFESIHPIKPDFGLEDVLELLEREPELSRINAKFVQPRPSLL